MYNCTTARRVKLYELNAELIPLGELLIPEHDRFFENGVTAISTILA